MKDIWNWFSKYTALHHITFASVWAVIGLTYGAYDKVPQVHAFVLQTYASLPAGWQGLIGAALAFYMWYHNGEKAAGTTTTTFKSTTVDTATGDTTVVVK